MSAASPIRPAASLTEAATVHAWAGARYEGSPTAALLALDATLGGIVRRDREPLVTQMRLTWWHESLKRLDDAPPPAQPVLEDLAQLVVTRGIAGRDVAAQVEAWEALLDPDAAPELVVETFAIRRGALFGLAARAIAPDATYGARDAGAIWALADLAANLTDASLAAAARRRGASIALPRCPRALRGLGGMARDAALALTGKGSPGSPRRAIAVARAALTGA